MNSRPSSHLPPPYAAHPLRTLWEHPDGTIYHTYSTTWRGLEFLMSYYPILDHTPEGRDEGEAWQLWIRRHDEYDSG